MENKNEQEEKSTFNGAVSSNLEIPWKLEQGSEIMKALKKTMISIID